MPSDNNVEHYNNTLSDLQALISYYSTCGNILVAGDCKGQIQCNNVKNQVSGCAFKTKVLTDFVHKNNLLATNMLDTCITTGPK